MPRSILTPSLHIKTIYDLPFPWLKDKGIDSIITDLDNTLVPWRDYTVAQELKDWFLSLHREGYKTIILTNARPSPTIERLSKDLDTPLVVGARKPLTRFFRRALEVLSSSPSQTAVIGDQIFTDVLGGNLAGCHTVLVDQIGRKEFFGTKVMRILERLVLARLPKE